jgi:uncharacterized surface anchored protein
VDENGLMEGQATCTLIFTNDFTKGKVRKTDIATGEPVIGATLQILPVDAEGNVSEVPILEWVSSAEDFYFERLSQGDYILREYSAPAGYVVAEDVRFTVGDTGEVQRIAMADDFTKVEIGKADIATGEAVIGAALAIFAVDAEGNVSKQPLYEWTTTEEPYLIERLPQGDYILREMSAPAGYVLSEDVPFTVEDTKEIQLVEMTDDGTRLIVSKLDAETGAFVAGATLQIIDAEGNVVYEWVSANKAYEIERIPQGDYTLHEAKAPAGYELADDVAFTVADTTEMQSVTMSDEAIPAPEKLDQTGRDGALPFAVIGVLALVVLGGVLFAVRHLRKTRDGADKGKRDESGKE